MKNEWPALIDHFTVSGVITDDTICVTTRSGAVRRLGKDIALSQRARFFDELFGDAGLAGWSGARNRPLISLS